MCVFHGNSVVVKNLVVVVVVVVVIVVVIVVKFSYMSCELHSYG